MDMSRDHTDFFFYFRYGSMDHPIDLADTNFFGLKTFNINVFCVLRFLKFGLDVCHNVGDAWIFINSQQTFKQV
jgi:hypothetical protein